METEVSRERKKPPERRLQPGLAAPQEVFVVVDKD
jgi:hypothetical protein